MTDSPSCDNSVIVILTGSSGAVAVPRDLSLLFCGECLNSELGSFDARIIVSKPPACVKTLSPFVLPGSVEVAEEVLNLIAKVISLWVTWLLCFVLFNNWGVVLSRGPFVTPQIISLIVFTGAKSLWFIR